MSIWDTVNPRVTAWDSASNLNARKGSILMNRLNKKHYHSYRRLSAAPNTGYNDVMSLNWAKTSTPRLQVYSEQISN